VEAIQTLINALVVGVVGLILARMTHNLRTEVKGEVAELRAELKGDIAELRSEIREVRSEVREVRSDLTRVALAVGAEPRAGRQQP
jgi:hypothetical protein